MKTIAKMAKINKHYKGIKTGRYFPRSFFVFAFICFEKKF